MAEERNYWQRKMGRRISRRAALRGAGLGVAGLAGAALIGCGDDDEEEATPTAAAAQTQTPVSGVAEAEEKRLDATGQAVGSTAVDFFGDEPGQYTFETGTPIVGGTWNAYYGGADGHFSPHHSGETATRSLLFDRLYAKLYRGEIYAYLQLAETVERMDELVTVVKLRESQFAPNSAGIERSVSAEDVMANFVLRREDSTSYQGMWYRGVLDWEQTEVVDEKTLKLVTGGPRADIFSGTNAYIVAKELIDAHLEGTKTLQEWDFPVGSGPYYTTKYVPGSYHELAKNPGYSRSKSDGWPYMDKVRAVKLADEANREAQFRAGNIDFYFPPNKLVFETILEDLGSGDKPKIYGVKNLTAAPGPGMVMNTMVPLFRNEQRFRKAVTLAFDRQKWIDTIAQGEGMLVGPGFNRFYDSFNLPEDHPALQEYWRYDPAEARKLVDALRAEGTYDLDREFVVLANGDSRVNQEYATLTKPMLEALGIKVRIETVGTAEFWGRQLLQENADFDFAFPGYYATPEEIVGAYMSSPTTHYQTGALYDAAYDEMAERWFAAIDSEEQAQIGRDIMLYLTDYYPLHTAMFQSFWRKLLRSTVRNTYRALSDSWQPWQWHDPSYTA